MNPQPYTSFGKNRTKTDGHNNQCRDCTSRLAAARYIRKAEQILKQNRCWRYEHKEEMTALKREWRKTRRQHEAERSREQRLHNLERRRMQERTYAHRRRAHKRSAPSDRSTALDVLAVYGNVCYLCCRRINMNDLHIDHVIPLARGGHDTLANKRPTHAFCNMSKGAKIYTGMSASQSVINTTSVNIDTDQVTIEEVK
jgi:5-methylcytosine-specific restriction endonuclease McrA